MKKVTMLFLSMLLLAGFSTGNAQLIEMNREDMMQESTKNAEMESRKIYHTFNSTYTLTDADTKVLDRLDTILEDLHNKNPETLRQLYFVVTGRLDDLGKQTRNSQGGVTDKKNTKMYFLLEQINNKISDFEGNQDLGCQKGLAHMQGNMCVSNTKNISNETGSGYQKYDFINEKWLPVMMTNCNSGFVKEESNSNQNAQVLCVEEK